MKLRNTLLGSTLLVAAFGSSALSLGRARGAVVLGQPLDLAVDVRLDSADDSGNACFEADVFHGDGQVPSSRVRVIVVSGAQGQDAVVRIRSAAVVDEPVVGVVLRSVCGQKASRRYDFLTDFPVETRAAAVPTIIPAVVTAPVSEAPMAAPVPMPTPRVVSERVANPVPVVRKPKPVPVSKPIVANVPKEAKEPLVVAKPLPDKPEVPDNKPRLKLESAETPDERLVQLKPASDVLLAPTDDLQKREAAAAAWRELNNLPVENTPEKQRLLALEAEAKTLKALLAQNDADFKLRLEKLENNRYGESFVLALLGLLLAAIAAAAFFWSRARQRLSHAATDWSHHGEPSVEELGGAVPLSRPAPLSSQLPPSTLPGPDHNAGVDESLFDDLKKLTAVTMPTKSNTPVSRPAATAVSARRVYPEDFLDVQQHADFFVSLGQYDQAIDVLKKSIHDSANTSPLAHLDLLKIYHTLGRQAEFQQQRDAFNRIFNCQISGFSAFTQEGKTLEGYPAVLRSIESQWGTPKVLDLIESHLFRDAASSAGTAFDLAAYRELLLLFAMAQGTVRKGDGSVHASMPQALSGHTSRRQELELDVTKPEPKDESTPRETSFTQPMLLMSEMASLDTPDTHPEPLVPSHRAPLDLDLDLNLDFSNSELLAMQELPAVPANVPSSPVVLDLDLGLGLEFSPSMPSPLAAQTPLASVPPVIPTIDSNMLEFDLFDPKVEAKISPKPKG